MPRANEWHAHLERELRTVAEPVPAEAVGACAEVTIAQAGDDVVDIDVRLGNQTDSASVALEDAPPEDRSRVAALIASNMLRALLAAEPTTSTPPTAKPRRRISLPIYGPGDLPAPPRSWLHVLLGGRFYLQHAPQLFRAEIGVDRSLSRYPSLRGSVGLIGDATFLAPEQGRLRAGTVGARIEGAVRLIHNRRLDAWLGPALETGVLIVASNPRGDAGLEREPYALVSADLRLRLDGRVSERALLYAALDVGSALHALTFRAGDRTLMAYASVYASLGLGMAFAR